MFQITLSEPTATLRWGKGGYKLFLQLVAKTNLSDLSVPPFNVTDCSLFLVVQTCKLKDVDAFIEQFNNLFYTTLRECLRILGENVVILVIFC